MKALLAIDGSQESEMAIETAASLDLAARSRLEIISVVPTEVEVLGGPFAVGAYVQSAGRARAAASTTAAAASTMRRSWSAPTGTRGRRARPRGPRGLDRSLEEAERTAARADHRGRARARDDRAVLLGSVSAEVVDHAHCPVLVARKPTAWRVLVATDGSPDAALGVGVRGRVRAVRARRRPDRERDRRARGLVARVRARRRTVARRCLASVVGEPHAHGAAVDRRRGPPPALRGDGGRAVVCEGPASAEIIAEADGVGRRPDRRRDARARPAQAMHRSAARRGRVLQHAPMSVLVVRPTSVAPDPPRGMRCGSPTPNVRTEAHARPRVVFAHADRRQPRRPSPPFARASRSTCTARRRRRRCCSTPSSRGRRSCATSAIVHLHTEGPGPAPRPGDGRPLPPPGAVHRAERPRGRQRGPGRLRPGLPVRRPAPVQLRARSRSTSCFVNATPARRARLLLARARASRRCTPRSARPTTVIVQFNRVDAADPRRQLHPRRRHRPRGRGRPAALRARDGADRRRRAPDRRARRRARPRRRHAPAGDRRDPGRDRRWPCTASATSASTPRCSPTRSSTSSRPGVVTGSRKERNRGKIVTAFLMGTPAAVRLRRRQPDGRDAPGRLHERHRTSSARSAGWSRSTRRSRSTSPARSWPTRSATACTPASAARWTSSAARRSRRRAGRSSRCPRPPRGGTVSRIVADAAGGRRRRHDAGPRRGRSSPSGAWPSCSAGACGSAAERPDRHRASGSSRRASSRRPGASHLIDLSRSRGRGMTFGRCWRHTQFPSHGGGAAIPARQRDWRARARLPVERTRRRADARAAGGSPRRQRGGRARRLRAQRGDRRSTRSRRPRRWASTPTTGPPRARPNLWGAVPDVVEMQSRGRRRRGAARRAAERARWRRRSPRRRACC